VGYLEIISIASSNPLFPQIIRAVFEASKGKLSIVKYLPHELPQTQQRSQQNFIDIPRTHFVVFFSSFFLELLHGGLLGASNKSKEISSHSLTM
jgi:hypothetical protein